MDYPIHDDELPVIHKVKPDTTRYGNLTAPAKSLCTGSRSEQVPLPMERDWPFGSGGREDSVGDV